MRSSRSPAGPWKGAAPAGGQWTPPDPHPMPDPIPSPVIIETAPRQRRSVFGNYAPATAATPVAADTADARAASRAGAPAGGCADVALARAFLHQHLARALDYPSPATWTWLADQELQRGLAVAVLAIEAEPGNPLQAAHAGFLAAAGFGGFARFHDDYVVTIGHAARGSCPPNEIEYGDLKADPLFQPHRLADLAAFYRAFGLETAADSDERLDHVSVQLEFMAVLCAQEAGWLNADPESEVLMVCRDAQRKFLREHLGRWTPAFARRLHRTAGDGPLAALALLLLAFVESECRRAGVRPGNEELLLRPADEAASLCDVCGLGQRLPGAALSPGPA